MGLLIFLIGVYFNLSSSSFFILIPLVTVCRWLYCLFTLSVSIYLLSSLTYTPLVTADGLASSSFANFLFFESTATAAAFRIRKLLSMVSIFCNTTFLVGTLSLSIATFHLIFTPICSSRNCFGSSVLYTAAHCGGLNARERQVKTTREGPSREEDKLSFGRMMRDHHGVISSTSLYRHTI